MATITGTLLQSELNTTVTVTTIEYLVDASIDSVNTDAGLSLAYMTGVAGAKTLTVTAEQATAIKAMTALKLASRASQGASSSSYQIGSLGVSQNMSSGLSSDDFLSQQYDRAIRKLCAREFRRT